VIFSGGNHAGAPKRQCCCAPGANGLNLTVRYRPEFVLPLDHAAPRLGRKRITDVLQNTVAGLLQPERLANPPRYLLGVNGTFSLYDGKREPSNLGDSEIEEVTAIGNHQRAFLVSDAGLCALVFCPVRQLGLFESGRKSYYRFVGPFFEVSVFRTNRAGGGFDIADRGQKPVGLSCWFRNQSALQMR
jgi:hypothetical protein